MDNRQYPNSSDRDSYNNIYDDDTTVMRPIGERDIPDNSQNNSAETTEFRPVESQNSEEYDDTNTIASISRKIERLKLQDRDPDREIYTVAEGLVAATASVSTEYSKVQSFNSSLESENNSLKRDKISLEREIQAMEAKNQPYSQSALEEREEEFNEKEKQNKKVKIILSAIALAFIILSLILGVMLSGEKEKSANSDNRSVTQQEQVRGMKNSLDDAKKGQAEANSKVSDLEGQINDLNDRLSQSEKDKKSAQDDAKSKSEEIDSLNNQINELSSQEPSTVTSTVTESQPPRTVTQSQSGGSTVTSTVTTERSGGLFN